MKDEDGAAGRPVSMGWGLSLEPHLVLPGGFVKTLKMLLFSLERVYYGLLCPPPSSSAQSVRSLLKLDSEFPSSVVKKKKTNKQVSE